MKRYQVFISSTYEDLKEERAEVLQVLLELDCIPCGMEYFPASDESQWNYIKNLIDICDYYLVVVGGRYGSEDENGMSYTEKEYRHAISKNIPVIAFIHGSPETLPVFRTDQDPTKKKKLSEFKTLVQKKLCKKYETKEQLGSLASRSMTQLIKSHPRTGWIRADEGSTQENLKDLLIAKKQIEELQVKLKEYNQYDLSVDSLSKGSEKVSLSYVFYGKVRWGDDKKIVKDDDTFTWDELFQAVAPKLYIPQLTGNFGSHLNNYLNEKLKLKHRNDFKTLDSLIQDETFLNIDLKFTDESIDILKVQFTALGFVEELIEKKPKKTQRLIQLTDLGQKELIKLRAIRKKKKSA